jgi:hypothetical protein
MKWLLTLLVLIGGAGGWLAGIRRTLLPATVRILNSPPTWPGQLASASSDNRATMPGSVVRMGGIVLPLVAIVRPRHGAGPFSGQAVGFSRR